METIEARASHLVHLLSKTRIRANYEVPIEDREHFNVANRPQSIFHAQWNTLFEPLVIENFLTPEEISALLLEKEKHQNTKASSRPGSTLKYPGWGEVEKNILTDKIQKAVGVCDVISGTYHEMTKPYVIHADLGKDTKLFPYANVLLPLQTSNPAVETQVVFFRQRYFGFSSSFYAAPRKNPPSSAYNENVLEYSRVFALSEQGFPEDQRLQYLSHCIPGDLNGLSIAHVIPWRVGSLIVFDPTQLHSSTNFVQQGLTQKTALTLAMGKIFSEDEI